jgi:hypothetical protein
MYIIIIITNSIQFDIYYSKVTGPRLNMLMLLKNYNKLFSSYT